MFTRADIAIVSTPRLQARYDLLEEAYDPDTMPSAEIEEMEQIDRELDARYFADHDDARVRQGMGAR